MPQASSALFELERVGYTYEAINTPAFDALTDINLTIQPGEFVAITGASGSGKSTLMHLLGLMAEPSRGTLKVVSQNVSNLDANAQADLRNKTIGFLFQQFFLLPQLTVLENILLPTEYSRQANSRSEWLSRAELLLEKFDLVEQGHKKPSRLSGGQRQRVALCRALIMNPDVLMCDEPTGALDSATAQEVLKTLVELNAEGRTIVVITHDPEVARCAKRVIRISDGRITSDEEIRPIKFGEKEAQLANSSTGNKASATTPRIHSSAKIMSVAYAQIKHSAAQMFVPTFESLATQRLRTVLTMTGLLLGVASIFIMLTLTGQVSRVFSEFFETQGARKAFVSFDGRQAEKTGAPQWRGMHVLHDLPKLNEQLTKLGRIDPLVSAEDCKILSSSNNFQGGLNGMNSLQEAQENNLQVSNGRLPMPHEFEESSGARIALLGSDAAVKLFSTSSGKKNSKEQTPVGQSITVRGCNFEGILTVVGVLKPQDSLMDRGINSNIYVPSNTLLTGGVSPYNRRVVTVPNRGISPTWFAQYVIGKLKIMTDNRFPFRFFAAEQELEKFNLMLSILTGLTLVIGALCTLIGGIGVMNIMLVNVHERIQEVGIRKAVGARDANIRSQFLLESTGLCLLSGALGTFVGIAVSAIALKIAQNFLPQAASLSFHLDIVALIVALIVSLGAGLIFGTWPARRAAALDIVDALKQE